MLMEYNTHEVVPYRHIKLKIEIDSAKYIKLEENHRQYFWLIVVISSYAITK